MPRVNYVKKARKSPGKCGKCGATINAGDSYKWFQFAFSSKSIRCDKPECAPKPVELTRSEWQQTMIGHEESFDSIRASLSDDLGAAAGDLESLADEVEGYGEEQDDKKSNMPEGLQESDTGQLLEERAEQCREIAEALREAASTIQELVDQIVDPENFSDTTALLEALDGDRCTKPECKDYETYDAFQEAVKEAVEEHNQSVIDEAEGAFDEVGWDY